MSPSAVPAPCPEWPTDKPSLARALAAIEAAPDAPATLALLDAAWAAPKGHVLGVTGPPGVGKSSLLRALIAADRARGRSVGVIAVDPSSAVSGGALLGDRTRFVTDPADRDLFVRSMAARDRLGGLAALVFPAVVLLRALFDRVIVETVGVGQSETAIAGIADTVLFCVQPASGDSLQFLKSGIVEIPHLCAVTKADLGAPAARAAADLVGALDLVAGGGRSGAGEPLPWRVPVLEVSVVTGAGLDRLDAAIAAHEAHLASPQPGSLPPRSRREVARARQAGAWLISELREEVGRAGVAALGLGAIDACIDPTASPFGRRAALRDRLEIRLR